MVYPINNGPIKFTHMDNNEQNNPVEKTIKTNEKRNWVSPELNNWATDHLEFGAGPFSDGGGRTYFNG
ncbi:hypothetical protein [Aquirufa nivalisilvae]|uniref:hypothetical protein n=1 Tax=Aquirufa nivalisilvae TaxID=2516557 RepID=UPI0010D66579|nr:hypothetical protein [Aquirufa nivalisilvae]TBH72267.1 hypothetical protein EWU22_10800 [Aquirufa nivalisilvae]